jgi:DNA-binding NtrC family response regulator
MEGKAKILVIDDSAETVAGLHSFFDNKYEVLTAANGLDGLKHIEENDSDIDLVITDLVMPDISGVGVISIVKKKYPGIPVIAITGWGKYPGIPVIAITGWGEHPEALATEADADLVLEKPFELSELDKSVSELLAKKKK